MMKSSMLPLMLAAAFAGCAALPPADAPADPSPASWHAPLPHGGSAADLSRWWQQFDDATMAALVDDAGRASPTLQQAAARIAQARAQARAAGAARLPALGGNASATRSRTQFPPPEATVTSAGASVDAAWELDLFGGTRSSIAAARAQAEGAQAAWHDARVSLAAEVADTYVALRACEAQTALDAQDLAAVREIADLTGAKVRAGFDAPATGALADANLAESNARAIAQAAQCELLVKALVALTAQDEGALRQRLASAATPARLPQPAALSVDRLPARALAQRPDLVAAARAIAVASADVGVAEADRWPRLTLLGSIGINAVRSGGSTVDGTTWSFGPSLSLPLFDAGRRLALADAARARHDEAVATYRGRALNAVREVEEALVRLDAAQRRQADAQRAAEQYARVFDAATQRWKAGAASQIELQDARRQLLGANRLVLGVQRERVSAWITLYKATGGGWDGRLDTAQQGTSR
jgi:multidrug efflux system outer membrane protein